VLNECRILKQMRCSCRLNFPFAGDRKFLRLIAGAASFKIELASLDFSTCLFSSTLYAYCVLMRNARRGVGNESGALISEPYAYKHPNAFNFPKAAADKDP
jgi:hypothetical protein